MGKNWDLPNWLPNVTQHALWYGHALTNNQSLPQPSQNRNARNWGGTAYIDMQKVGCALIQELREAQPSLPAGFARREPAPPSHLTLIMLAELLIDLPRPVDREDLDRVGSDIGLILAAEGDLATTTAFSHSRLFSKRQVGRGKDSPLQAFNEAFGEWEARTSDCRQPFCHPFFFPPHS